MNIGLVLSGGMAKGAYQIGALKALGEFIPLSEIKYISCASIGVLNGYAFATGCLDQAEDMWKAVCSEDTRMLVTQILRSSILQQNIAKIYNPDAVLSASLYCALYDLNQKSLVYKNLQSVEQKEIPLYLKASVAMPVYNRAIHVDGTSYFDGAMIDNIPVFPLMKHNLDYIICIYFDDTCYKFESTYFDNKVIKLTFPCESRLKQSLVFKRNHIEDMIRDGYDRTTYLLGSALAKGYDNLDYIYRAIEYRNKNAKEKSLRITGDVLVTNLNKVTQKFAKRKIVL